jgi:hypothetical protein
MVDCCEPASLRCKALARWRAPHRATTFEGPRLQAPAGNDISASYSDNNCAADAALQPPGLVDADQGRGTARYTVPLGAMPLSPWYTAELPRAGSAAIVRGTETRDARRLGAGRTTGGPWLQARMYSYSHMSGARTADPSHWHALLLGCSRGESSASVAGRPLGLGFNNTQC